MGGEVVNKAERVGADGFAAAELRLFLGQFNRHIHKIRPELVQTLKIRHREEWGVASDFM